jgi:hypothetical protein
MTTHHRLVSTWVAILAILLNALVPTVSLAFDPARNQGQQGGSEWIEICTTQGSSWVQLGPDGQIKAQTTQRPDGAPAATHNGHCLYCLTHAASFGLLPAPAMVQPVVRSVADLVPALELPVHIRLVWLIPAARAPPIAT